MLLLLPTVRSATCTHPVFCNRTLLDALSPFFNESKDFVDSYLAYPLIQVLAQFHELSDLPAKVKRNFISPQAYIQQLIPSDYSESPELFKTISQPLREVADPLNRRWLSLSKQFKFTKVSACQQSCSTVPPQFQGKQFFFPGGRFRQAYYWDSYWILKGLLAVDMLDSAMAILDVMFSQVTRLGYIPNGFRIYYEGRSQPPLLALMVNDTLTYLQQKQMKTLASALKTRAYPLLKKQFSFWMQNRSRIYTVRGRSFNVSYYSSAYDQERPQVFSIDKMILQRVEPKQRARLARDINAAAESGWDFSTRWTNGTSDLTNLRTTSVVPSDLNFYLAYLSTDQNQKLQLSKFISLKKLYFQTIYDNSTKLFHDGDGVKGFYPSSILPHLLLNTENQAAKLVAQLLQSFQVPPPTSLLESGLQWDGYNVWAPNTYFLSRLGQGQQLAKRWLSNVRCGWLRTGQFFQKYDSRYLGRAGGGGQYVIQQGFGWTNGLALHFIKQYPQTKLMDCQEI